MSFNRKKTVSQAKNHCNFSKTVPCLGAVFYYISYKNEKNRKNLDFGITTGETNYILKSASDNIYNLIEPFCWRVFGNILSLVFIVLQVFTINIWAGLFELLLIVIILVCVYLRTKIQKGVVDKIEVQNAKIGNYLQFLRQKFGTFSVRFRLAIISILW